MPCHGIHPAPGIPTIVEDRDSRRVDVDPEPPRQFGDPRVGLDSEHPAAGRLELPGGEARCRQGWPCATRASSCSTPPSASCSGTAALRGCAGTGTVADNLTGALMELFGSVAVAIVGLITFRNGLRARLRQARPTGVPVLAEATAMLTSYLAAERELGRIAADADADTLALTLIGTGHLLFAGVAQGPPR